jgi:predicted Fe-Mo cluster-binding NifX family protein
VNSIFAIPTVDGKACQHFGHCERFALVEVQDGAIAGARFVDPPEHQPGLYPRFLADHGVHVVLAGGMGQKARALFQQQGIEVQVGVSVADPSALVQEYLRGALVTDANQCDHSGHAHGGDGCGR